MAEQSLILPAEIFTRLAALHFGPYCAKWAVGEARFDKSVGRVNPS